MNKAHILIIDDNESDALLMQEAIKDASSEVQTSTVHSATEALDLLNKKNEHADAITPNLIFLDLRMPGMDGHEFLRVVKTDPAFSHIPIIVFTASKKPEDVTESYKLYANCCITKPENFIMFKKVVNVINDYWLGIAALPNE